VATWMLYLIPLLLCLLVWKPWLPILVAAVATILIVADWYLSPPGITGDIAVINRGIGIIITWGAAVLERTALATRAKLRREEWIRTARARIADVVVGEQSLRRLGERVLEVLAKHLGAQVGAMYIAEASGAYSRVASLGLPAESTAPTAFRPGEGLLGRSIAERHALRIEDLPADYLLIASGLGSRKPHALLVAPLTTDEAAHGVIELGFLHPTYDSDLELLTTVAEPIAIAIRTGMLRRERENLLRETQRQAEELQTQQEELRVANEELLSQSAQLRDSQARLETQQAELEQTNVHLEEHAQKLGQQHDELIGAKLDLIDHQTGHRDIQRHGFDGANIKARRLGDDFLLARDQRHFVRTAQLDDAVIDFARQQAQRQSDHAGLVGEHALDGKMGLAGIGWPQNRRHFGRGDAWCVHDR